MSDRNRRSRPLRKEDKRFITGQGRYTDDINVPGHGPCLFPAQPARACQLIKVDRRFQGRRGDAGRARRAHRQDDLATDKVGGLICGWMIHSKDGSPMNMGAPVRWRRAKVRYVGDAVAVVVAETLAQARDAAEAIVVDYEELPAVTDTVERDQGRRAAASPEAPGNTVFNWASRRQGRDRRCLPRPPSTSPSSTSSTTGWCRTRWSRALRSATTMQAEGAFTLLHDFAEPACRAARALGVHTMSLRRTSSRDRSGCRRRLRLEDLHLSEETVCVWAAKKAPAAR
jgi:carbon-monoxide dehydrogenase large subunit